MQEADTWISDVAGYYKEPTTTTPLMIVLPTRKAPCRHMARI